MQVRLSYHVGVSNQVYGNHVSVSIPVSEGVYTTLGFYLTLNYSMCKSIGCHGNQVNVTLYPYLC